MFENWNNDAWTIPDDAHQPQRRSSIPDGTIRSFHGPDCFGCASAEGLRVVVVAHEDLSVTGSMFTYQRFQGGPGVLHGGIVSALIDEISSNACQLVVPYVVTGRLSVEYLTPVPIEQEICVRARVIAQHRRKLYVQSTAYLAASPESPLARGQAIFIEIIPEQHFSSFASADNISSITSRTL